MKIPAIHFSLREWRHGHYSLAMPRLYLGLAVLVQLSASGCATGLPVGGRLAMESGESMWLTRGMGGSGGAGLEPIEASKVELDWFQGLLLRGGVSFEDLPDDGRRLRAEDAQVLLGQLLSAEVGLRDFGPWRMGAHLLAEVMQGGTAVSRRELHARMRRFQALLVLRPDGCLAKATTGQAVQCVGEVRLVDGELRAEGFTVGPFYAVRNRYLYPVDARLGIHPDAVMAGVYAPDEGTLGPMAEGAGHAVVDAVEGVVNLVMHPINTVEGLAQLPVAVRTLIQNSPEYWEQFRALPHGAQVRAVSRLITNVVILAGTAGAGASGAASLGGKLGSLRLAVLSLSAEGALALRSVVVPAGQLVTAIGAAPGAVYVLHMAKKGAEGAGRPVPRPDKGPGRWEKVNPTGSERAQSYQQQITGRPASEVYRIGDVEFDGFTDGVLLEAKGPGYRSLFEANGDPKPWYRKSGKFDELVKQARHQAGLAERLKLRLRWAVAEPEVATLLAQLFKNLELPNIEVVYTPAAP